MNAQENVFSQELCNYCQRFDLLDMLNDAVLLIDAQQGNLLFMNQKALEMYQYDKREITDLSVLTLNHAPGETVRANMEMVINQANKGYVFTTNHVKKNGTIFKVEVSARSLMMHGRHIIASLVRDLTAEGKMREELALAGKILRRLLPRNLETAFFHMRTVYQPLNGLSGDLYDVRFDEESQVLYGIIIDVMGHGVAAASQSGILRYLFRQAVEKCIPVNDKLSWINNEVIPFFSSGGFAAVFLFEFDFKCRILSYSSAGINQFFRVSGTALERIKSPGLFVGINENEGYDLNVISFQSGDSFFFLTDGLLDIIKQHIDQPHTFWSMYELCKTLSLSQEANDDASGIGILVR